MYENNIVIRPSESSFIKQLRTKDSIIYSENLSSYTDKISKTLSKNNITLYKIKTLFEKEILITSDSKLKTKVKGEDSNYIDRTIEQIITLKGKSRNYNPLNCKGETYSQPNESLLIYTNDRPLNLSNSNLSDLPPYWIGHLLFNLYENELNELFVYLKDEYFYDFKTKFIGINQHRLEENSRNTEKLYKLSSYQKVNGIDEINLELKNLNILSSNLCNRFIHKSYIYTSIENRIDLLKGIIHAIGKKDLKNNVYLDVYSLKMAKDINLLISTLGGWSFYTKDITGYKVYIHLPNYLHHINYSLFNSPFLPLELPITEIEQLEIVNNTSNLVNSNSQSLYTHALDDTLFLITDL